jgi:uncharacterized membrane protein
MGKSHFVWLGFAFLAFAVLVAANDVKYWYTYERHAANVVVSVSATNDFCATEDSRGIASSNAMPFPRCGIIVTVMLVPRVHSIGA